MRREAVIPGGFEAAAPLPLVRLWTAPGLVGAASAALLAVTVFFGGGTDTDRLLPIALSAVFVASAALVASLAGLLPAPRIGRPGVAFFALLGAFALWSGLSVTWSIAPDLSWDLVNRELAYLAFAVAGLYAGALLSKRLLAQGLAVLLGAALAWALAGKIFPALFPDGARFARLRSPVGYWNGLALLAAIALVLGLWLATAAGRRLAGALLVYVAFVAVFLTYSRSGIALAALGALAWIALSGKAFEALATLAVAGGIAAPVVAFALTRHGIADDHQLYSVRVHDGAWFAPVLIGGALAVVALTLALRRVELGATVRRRIVKVTLGAVAVAAAAAVLGSVVQAGGPGPWLHARARAFSSSGTIPSQEAGRLTSLSSNRRWDWWQEAWRSFEDAPAVGRGAGTFPIVHRLERTDKIVVTEPHNLLLQALSDTGAIGFVLLLGAIAAAVVAARRTIQRLAAPERLAALALSIGAAAYLLQALVDVDWDFVATSGPVLFMVGALAGGGLRERAVRPLGTLAFGCALFGCAAAASLLIPWLSARQTSDAYAAIQRGDARAAATEAKRAHSLNPFSLDPLYALAGARELERRPLEAEAAYAEAVRVQPKNPDAWYELGSFELGNRAYGAACSYLARSHVLDPHGPGGAQRAEACRKARGAG